MHKVVTNDNLHSRLHTGSNYFYSQKSMQDFVLSPPPSGYILQHPNLPPSQPIFSPSYGITNSSSNTGPNSGSHSYVKPCHQSSPLASEISVQSSKYNHFNFHHSPVPERSLNFGSTEVSYSHNYYTALVQMCSYFLEVFPVNASAG